MISDFYTDTIEIHSYTSSTGWGSGSWSKDSEVSGFIRPLSGEERYAADKKTVFSTHRMYCDPVAIDETNRVVSGGKTFSVKWVNNPMKFDRFYQIDLELVE
jgi:hypothetical protein